MPRVPSATNALESQEPLITNSTGATPDIVEIVQSGVSELINSPEMLDEYGLTIIEKKEIDAFVSNRDFQASSFGLQNDDSIVPCLILPLVDEQVLLTPHENIVDVTNVPKIGVNKVTENTGEIIKFGLTLTERQSIEDDVSSGKPIMATSAYTKFLSKLLPDGLKVEDENGILKFSRDIPEYEIHNGAIRANHIGAIAIIEGLSELFETLIDYSLNATELKYKIRKHSHFAGIRLKNGKSKYLTYRGCAWCNGLSKDGMATYAFVESGGGRDTRKDSCCSGMSLFPSFA